MVSDVAADVADIVAVGIHVVAAVGLQLGVLAGGGVPVLGGVVKPHRIKRMLMGGLLVLVTGGEGGQDKGQKEEQSEYLFHVGIPPNFRKSYFSL